MDRTISNRIDHLEIRIRELQEQLETTKGSRNKQYIVDLIALNQKILLAITPPNGYRH